MAAEPEVFALVLRLLDFLLRLSLAAEPEVVSAAAEPEVAVLLLSAVVSVC